MDLNLFEVCMIASQNIFSINTFAEGIQMEGENSR